MQFIFLMKQENSDISSSGMVRQLHHALILLSPLSLAGVFTLMLVSLLARLLCVLFQAGERDGAKDKSMPKSMYQQKVCHLLSAWPALHHVAIRED